MLAKLIPLFLIIPLVELALLIELGRYIGSWNTILLVIITGVVGAVLAKLEGLRVWHNLQEDLLRFKLPTDKIIDSVLVLVGGILLLTPGILTDILGFLLLLPWTRFFFRENIKKRWRNKFQQGHRVIEVDKLK